MIKILIFRGPEFSKEDTLTTGKSGVIKKKNVKDDEKARYTCKGKDSSNIVFIVSAALVLGLVKWLEKQGMMDLVSKQYLKQSKELAGHKEFKKLSAWAGEAYQLVSDVDLVVYCGGSGSLLRVCHMVQDSMSPVLDVEIGGSSPLSDLGGGDDPEVPAGVA